MTPYFELCRSPAVIPCNYLLKCLALIGLTLTYQDISRMDVYVRLLDDLRRGRRSGTGHYSPHRQGLKNQEK